MQRAFINCIYDLAEKNPNVVFLTADNGTDFDSLFSRAFPDQYYNLGIAEENLVAVAAGMAMCGKIPFICSAGAFLAYRAYEFIRNDLCFQEQNVKIVALGSGLSISALGPTHHTTEDISALKAIPGLRILSIASPLEVEAAMEYAMLRKGPVYLRLGMNATKEYHHKVAEINLEGINVLRQGKDALIFATGDVVAEALSAGEMLAQDGIDLEVDELISLKPLNKEEIIAKCRDRKFIFTVEEHNVLGGLGESLASALNEAGMASIVHKIGLNDRFAQGFGSQRELQEHNGLDAAHICQRIVKEMNS
jgi:transketolase